MATSTCWRVADPGADRDRIAGEPHLLDESVGPLVITLPAPHHRFDREGGQPRWWACPVAAAHSLAVANARRAEVIVLVACTVAHSPRLGKTDTPGGARSTCTIISSRWDWSDSRSSATNARVTSTRPWRSPRIRGSSGSRASASARDASIAGSSPARAWAPASQRWATDSVASP